MEIRVTKKKKKKKNSKLHTVQTTYPRLSLELVLG